MNYSQIRQYDIANGEGIRSTLFVSGCAHKCKSCFNLEYQNFNCGNEWTKKTEDYFISLGKDDNVSGYSILGGEPFQQDVNVLLSLFKRIKSETRKSIWLWTGFTLDKIPKQYNCLFPYIDVLVDGRFIESKKDLILKWRGSSNQKIYIKNKEGEWYDASTYYDNKNSL